MLKTLEYLGIDTYENLEKTKAKYQTLPYDRKQIIDYVLEIERITEQNAETYNFHRFIKEWIDSRNNPTQDKIERFAVLIPENMPFGAMAFTLSVFLSQTDDLSEIARVLREKGFKVYHNRTGIDPYTPNDQIKVFCFEDKDNHIIWIIKREGKTMNTEDFPRLSLPYSWDREEFIKTHKNAIWIGTEEAEIIIIGNTYPIKETLKKLGFKWSYKNKWWYYPHPHTAELTPSAMAKKLRKEGVTLEIYVQPTWVDEWIKNKRKN